MDYPFFNVGIELSVPAVVTNPTLHAVQAAINIVAKQVRGTTCDPDHYLSKRGRRACAPRSACCARKHLAQVWT